MLKSGCRTCNVAVVVCTELADVPVMVSVYKPGGVLGVVVMVSSVLAVGVTGLALQAWDVLGGRPAMSSVVLSEKSSIELR